MSWGFEAVATTREEALCIIDSHKAIPVEIKEVMKAVVPVRWHEGISMIVKSNGHVDTLAGPCNFNLELCWINDAKNSFYRPTDSRGDR